MKTRIFDTYVGYSYKIMEIIEIVKKNSTDKPYNSART